MVKGTKKAAKKKPAKKPARRRKEEREAEFLAMTPAQKRVAIARDTIEQIEAQKFIPQQGVYFHWVNPADHYGDRPPGFDCRSDAREALEDNTVKCTGCALGGMFASFIRRVDGVDVQTARGSASEDIKRRMSEFFDEHTLTRIEYAFERWTSDPARESDSAWEDLRRHGRWGKKFRTSEKRLTAIMKNIIRNRGEFRLPRSFK